MPIVPRPLGHAYSAGRQPARRNLNGVAASLPLPTSHGGAHTPLPMVRPVSAPQDFRVAPPYVVTASPSGRDYARRGIPSGGMRGLTPPPQNRMVDLTATPPARRTPLR